MKTLIIVIGSSVLMFLGLYYFAKFSLYSSIFIAVGASILTFYVNKSLQKK